MRTTLQCPKCQRDNREGAKFCEACGTELSLACPNCGNTPERQKQKMLEAVLRALLEVLDKLSTAREVTQLGATLGREFSYELPKTCQRPLIEFSKSWTCGSP
jgi:predicted amidophosphoribosyltransferase